MWEMWKNYFVLHSDNDFFLHMQKMLKRLNVGWHAIQEVDFVSCTRISHKLRLLDRSAWCDSHSHVVRLHNRAKWVTSVWGDGQIQKKTSSLGFQWKKGTRHLGAVCDPALVLHKQFEPPHTAAASGCLQLLAATTIVTVCLHGVTLRESSMHKQKTQVVPKFSQIIWNFGEIKHFKRLLRQKFSCFFVFFTGTHFVTQTCWICRPRQIKN